LVARIVPPWAFGLLLAALAAPTTLLEIHLSGLVIIWQLDVVLAELFAAEKAVERFREYFKACDAACSREDFLAAALNHQVPEDDDGDWEAERDAA
jgi:hypothetical protein